MKDLVERKDRFEVMMEALIGKMVKLSTKMISRYNVPSCKGNKTKRLTRRALSPPDESVAENSYYEDEDDVVNHARKSHKH
jgi:oligoribonuclease (3'-5' exoribonuclease)